MKSNKIKKNLGKQPKHKIKLNMEKVKKPPKNTKKPPTRRLKINIPFERALAAIFGPKRSKKQ